MPTDTKFAQGTATVGLDLLEQLPGSNIDPGRFAEPVGHGVAVDDAQRTSPLALARARIGAGMFPDRRRR